MIFADKLIELRKKSGWTQEEFAHKMGVTRQSVSKWEGAISIPDLDKIIHISELFGVSTDYLLKDDIKIDEAPVPEDKELSLRRVSLEEANEFISAKVSTSRMVAFGVFLCIISPVTLILLMGFSEKNDFMLSENVAVFLGIVAIFLCVATSISLFTFSSKKTSKFDYLDKEIFETAYGVTSMVKERKEQYKDTHTRRLIIGIFLVIVSVLPTVGVSLLDQYNSFLILTMTALIFVIAGIGVFFLVRTGTIWGSFDRLLQEGAYCKEKKERSPTLGLIIGIYWPLVGAMFLAYSFITDDWGRSWIIWPVAAVFYPVVIGVSTLFKKK